MTILFIEFWINQGWGLSKQRYKNLDKLKCICQSNKNKQKLKKKTKLKQILTYPNPKKIRRSEELEEEVNAEESDVKEVKESKSSSWLTENVDGSVSWSQ